MVNKISPLIRELALLERGVLVRFAAQLAGGH
jgi:hypothetical protein